MAWEQGNSAEAMPQASAAENAVNLKRLAAISISEAGSLRHRDRMADCRRLAGTFPQRNTCDAPTRSGSGRAANDGGFRLARKPDDIDIGGVIRQQENLTLLDCSGCPAAGCKLPRMFQDGIDRFLSAFDGKTLADLV
jgi:hypothetical protein